MGAPPREQPAPRPPTLPTPVVFAPKPASVKFMPAPKPSILVASPRPVITPAAPVVLATPRPTAPASSPPPPAPPPVVDVDDRGNPVGGPTDGAPAAPAPTPPAASAPVLATPTGIFTRVDAPPDADNPMTWGMPSMPPPSGVQVPAPLPGGFPGNQTDTTQTASPLRDPVTQLPVMSVGLPDLREGEILTATLNTGIVPPSAATGGGFHLSMALVLLGVGLVALALWKLEE